MDSPDGGRPRSLSHRSIDSSDSVDLNQNVMGTGSLHSLSNYITALSTNSSMLDRIAQRSCLTARLPTLCDMDTAAINTPSNLLGVSSLYRGGIAATPNSFRSPLMQLMDMQAHALQIDSIHSNPMSRLRAQLFDPSLISQLRQYGSEDTPRSALLRSLLLSTGEIDRTNFGVGNLALQSPAAPSLFHLPVDKHASLQAFLQPLSAAPLASINTMRATDAKELTQAQPYLGKDGIQQASRHVTFPMVLHKALTELERVDEGADIASFLHDGHCFLIKDHEKFEKMVLPHFFPRMKCFASFQRQLNLYGFKRLGGTGLEHGAYFHDMFIRSSPDQASRMRRAKTNRLTPRPAKDDPSQV